MSIQIISPGALTTVQDYGRTGLCEIGLSPSGAVDFKSMELANILVGNEMEEAVLECTLMGPTLQFTKDNVIAITGAFMDPKINGRPIPVNRAVAVKAGEVLTLGFAAIGCRAYIAFAGGLKIKECFGSKSTNMKCGIGGLYGRALKAKDEIEFAHPTAGLKGMEKRVLKQIEAFAFPRTIRVIMGPQDDYFTQEGIHTFLSSPYILTKDSDRMACRLSGPVIAGKKTTDIISDGIASGSIQVASNGQPMVMLADRQTTGGYAKIATVISTDIPYIAQCKPGDSLLFQSVSIETAHKLYRERVKAMRSLRRSMQ